MDFLNMTEEANETLSQVPIEQVEQQQQQQYQESDATLASSSAAAVTTATEIATGDVDIGTDEMTDNATALSTVFKPVKNPMLFPTESATGRTFVKKIQDRIIDNSGRGVPRDRGEDVEIEVDRRGRRRRQRRAGCGKQRQVRQYEPRHDVPFTSEVRANAIHVYGTDHCSNSDLFAYFAREYPHEIEWINDSSCNIVFKNEEFAQQALRAHETSQGKDGDDEEAAANCNSPRLQRRQSSGPAPVGVDSPLMFEKPLCSPPPPSPTPSSLKSEVRVEENANDGEGNANVNGNDDSCAGAADGTVKDTTMEDDTMGAENGGGDDGNGNGNSGGAGQMQAQKDDVDEEEDGIVDREAEDGVRIIPWVKCVPFKTGDGGFTVNLQIRQATVEDVKSENRKKSLYYKRILDEHRTDHRNFRHNSSGNPCKKIRLSDERSYNNDGTITITRK